ncbi:DUF1365 domain-containing protein [Cocleimonas sp. KMM 6892]|uniref:DUF1365 domain-containing protein n=1 Tax=unclassified Cocleimonas TaxID=2639732 RepID=UPI002DB7ABBB|nr:MULTISPECIES: DUF1365 domain-containing protein [unclassified Cocleimonas]MEB8431572.1 DUF1365 domain-containing protein [Cocleimonas sp. KMM 6892]MEC4713656.1 DUF1365 domain-containing protein [Cocleimonas sp. KMM 6895]MEC4742987.1 DUF1365 domain-containing protein [Cocleimonas sp. KMM 6896]
MSSALSLYECDVMHRRHFPQNYRFNYKVFSFLIDIDEVKQSKVNPLFSFNRFNLYSVYTKDHGARDGSGWRAWIDTVLDERNLSKAKHQVKLLCFPRILGYAFNPLSLWYCFGEDGQLYAVVCEVSNTFGEHHHYVLHNDNQPYKGRVKAHKKKHFHVSPFISMDAEYRFTIGTPKDELMIVINEYQDNELMLTATQMGEQQEITTPHLLGQFFRLPLMTFKIMWLIHWQALKIWMRGGVYHKKPEAPKEDFS